MTGQSILYLGHSDNACGFCNQLEAHACCKLLVRHNALTMPDDLPESIDLVMFEPGVSSGRSRVDLPAFLAGLAAYPVIAVVTRESEQRGIAMVRAGAQSYLCADDAGPTEIELAIDHAVQRHHLLARLSEADSTVLSILKSINDGAIVVDRHGHVLEINPAARSLLGLAPREKTNSDWAKTFCARSADGRSEIDHENLPLVKACRGQKFSNQIATFKTADNIDIILSINGQGLFDADQSLVGGVITFRDITGVVRKTVELELKAYHDELTELPNRRLFTLQLNKAMGRSQRSERALAVLFIDLDRFKSVNDTLGHDVGDELLRQVASRLNDNLRVGDFCGRWGGDEFVVCLEDFGEDQNAAAAAQKLVLVLSDKYDVKGSEVHATPSIGIATFPGDGETAEQLIKAADLAMYQAKNRGGGRFQYFSSSMNALLEQREELEVGLRHALVRKEFVLHYQPRIDVGSGRLIGLEALVRWQHPRLGLLQPARFLTILESSGLIHSAGEWVINTACRQLAAWRNKFELPDLSISINLSQQQLRYGRLVESVSAAIANNALDAGCIEFEISDGGMVRQRRAELETLRGLRSLGVRLSLDHFGTRDVSLSALDAGVIDSFILDQSLIQDVEVNGSHQRIVRATIAMARGLEIEVAAEGVETISQLEFLRHCNCDLAQGFLISRPVQADKVSRILRSEIAGTRLI